MCMYLFFYEYKVCKVFSENHEIIYKSISKHILTNLLIITFIYFYM